MIFIDFKSAEEILIASLLAEGPPLMLVGRNSLGKTKLLETISEQYKNTQFTTSVDYGGFKQYEHLLIEHKIKNIVVSDLQRILNRPKNVRSNILGLISSLTSEGTQFELTFDKNRPVEDFRKRKKNYLMNVVFGCTEDHLRVLIREGYHDLMVRFIYLFVERDTSTIDYTKPYQVSCEIKKRFDKSKYAALQISQTMNAHPELLPREAIMFSKLQNMTTVLGYKPTGQVQFYRPKYYTNDKVLNLDIRLFTTN